MYVYKFLIINITVIKIAAMVKASLKGRLLMTVGGERHVVFEMSSVFAFMDLSASAHFFCF